MQELLSKTKFINALAREHISIEKVRQEHDRETFKEYLRLEVIATNRTPQKTSRLVIRGNQLGTHWMILDQEFTHTLDGVRRLHKCAVEVAFAAAQKASNELKQPVQIGMPPIEYFDAWFD